MLVIVYLIHILFVLNFVQVPSGHGEFYLAQKSTSTKSESPASLASFCQRPVVSVLEATCRNQAHSPVAPFEGLIVDPSDHDGAVEAIKGSLEVFELQKVESLQH